MTEPEIRQQITDKLDKYFAVSPENATDEQMYNATLMTVRDLLMKYNTAFEKETASKGAKKAYYMCMEFLIGPSLKANLCNLGLYDEYKNVLSSLGFSLNAFIDRENDPGLGNGGLGRLAACYMNSLTAQSYPATGHCICYEYGLFKQKIVDCEQAELPDIWLPTGEAWLVPRTDLAVTVQFGGTAREIWRDGRMYVEYEDADEVEAVPYDIFISGAGTTAVNNLRLWRARDFKSFDMKAFSQGKYLKALEESTRAELISKVLYPSDDHDAGKMLRLTQQYFLVSAALQNILHDHLEKHGTADDLPEYAAIHINDTHPAMCVAELMRLLLDECDYSWEQAWDITTKTMSYTNHTVMPEALETWNQELFRLRLPRIYTIICEINRRYCEMLWNDFTHDRDKINRMSIVGGGVVRMANLSVVGSHTVNGVSALHSDILKHTVFSDFYGIEPYKFTNVTNGIDHRRWLLYSNPGLTALLDECIGTDYKKDTELLSGFSAFRDDKAVLERLAGIKKENKIRLAAYARENKGIKIDPDTVFDVHIKRMHEYKRQLLNVLRIISIYNDILEDPGADMIPQTFIFSAKAAPGYYHAKQIIKLINHLSADIEKRPEFKGKLSVAFLENYCVSLAEKLIPAAEISEQISLSGKEASGTGNMKLMMNGAVTIGTLDGANVEMYEKLDGKSFYLFGLTTSEVDALWASGYSSASYYNKSEKLQNVIKTLNRGFNGVSFSDFSQYLLYTKGIPDPYMCFADFASYNDVHNRMTEDYKDKTLWAQMSLDNIAASGVFSSDRSVREYADNIWHIKPVK